MRLLLLLLVAGCASSNEVSRDAAVSESPDASDAVDGGTDAGPIVCPAPDPEGWLRTLRPERYARVFEDVVGEPPARELRAGGDELGTFSASRLDPVWLEAVHENAVTGAATLAAACSDEECHRRRIPELLRTAFRREPRADELALYEGSYEQTLAVAEPALAFEAVVVAILHSPWFLHVIELGEPGEGERWSLTPEEHLTRLALTFEGRGATGADLPTQLEAWSTTPYAGTRFVPRWLGRARADDPDLAASQAEETRAFVESVFADPAGSYTALLSSSHTFVDARLAEVYDVPPPPGDELVRVDLDPDRYASLLTHGSWLAARTIAARGTLVAERFLCRQLPGVPADLELEPTDELPGDTERERYEAYIASEPVCVTCHEAFDGFGFALDGFDREGRRREGADTSGAVGEIRFDGARDLAEHLASSPEARSCFVQQWGTYMLERDLDAWESCALLEIGAAFAENDDLSDMLVALGTSEPLSTRSPRPTDALPVSPEPRELATVPATLALVEEELRNLTEVLTLRERMSLERHLDALVELRRRVELAP